MYTNIDEINSSSQSSSITRFARGTGGGGDNNTFWNGNSNGSGAKSMDQSTVIATARGIFGSEGGSLVSAETGVSIIIPPHAIPEGVTQEIYFKVCEDNKLAPPLDRNLG